MTKTATEGLNQNEIKKIAIALRKAHLIRHQFVAWPLLEYTETSESLVTVDLRSIIDIKTSNIENEIPESIQEIAPRFIHLDEILLFQLLGALRKNEINTAYSWGSIEKYFSFSSVRDAIRFSSGDKKEDAIVRETKINDSGTSDKKKKLLVGIANIHVNEKDIEASYHPNKQPNLLLERQSNIFNIINEAIRKPKCDLIVLPEVSIPYAWLPFMVDQARKTDIGMIFGLEHLPLKNKQVYNLIATLLPFRTKGGYHNCFISLRNKNHYSPRETEILHSLGLTKPNEEIIYDRFNWRRSCFSSYNCFELTDVNHRGIFRSDVDFLVSVSYNKDINRFSNIIEATTRDVHSFMVHVNTSQFGDSRIISPKKTEEKDIVRVTGGVNPVLMKGYLDIEGLRHFQSHSYRQDDTSYKPTPAGFDHKAARGRCNSQK